MRIVRCDLNALDAMHSITVDSKVFYYCMVLYSLMNSCACRCTTKLKKIEKKNENVQ